MASLLADQSSKNYFPALTGIRAIAAWMVFFHHYNPFLDVSSFQRKFVQELHTGVSIFFVLSGFLICLRYYENVKMTGNWWGHYIRNRVARIYPVFFLLTTLTYIVRMNQVDSGIHGSEAIGNYFMNITFVSGFHDHYFLTGISQAWSLTVEECFYFSAPILFFLFRKQLMRFLAPLLLIFIGITLVFICNSLNVQGFFAGYKFMLLYTFPGRCVEFCLGAMLALWYMKRRHENPAGFKIPWLTLSGVLGILLVLGGMVSLQGTSPFSVKNFSGIAVNNFVFPWAVIIFFAGLLTEKSILRSFLGSKIMQIMGKSSYVFYLIHMGVVNEFISPFFSKHIYLYDFLVLNLVSIIICYCIEEPLNRAVKKIWKVKPGLANE